MRVTLLATLAAPSLLAAAALVAPIAANAASLHALTADGKLVMIDSETRRSRPAVKITGAPGPVLSIALRPADGKLYGLTATQLVVIDPATGRATPGATFDKPVETGPRASVNFNPTVDRMRVVGMGGNNYRINVDTGAVTVDGTLKYGPATPFATTAPRVTAAAYTNHMAGAKETMLMTIDTSLGQLNLQAPPNDGIQQPKKDLGTGLPNGVGFDILADAGTNTGYLLANGRLTQVAMPGLETKELGAITGLPTAEIISLAAAK